MQLFRKHRAKTKRSKPKIGRGVVSAFEVLELRDVEKTLVKPKASAQQKNTGHQMFSTVSNPQKHFSRIGYKDGMACIQIEPPLNIEETHKMNFSIINFMVNTAKQKPDVKIIEGAKATGFLIEVDQVAGKLALECVERELERIDQEAGVIWDSFGNDRTGVIDVNCL